MSPAASALGRASALVGLALAVGCGAGSDRAVGVELWALGREGEMVEQLLPAFERAHPGIRVRVQQIPWSAAHEKLLTAYVGGAAPDVLQAGNTWLPELVALGALEPLDPWIERSAVVVSGDYFPGILDTNVIDGVTYGIPWYVDTRVLFYRADVLREVGHPEPPRTWDAWTEAMLRVKARGGTERFAILLPIREWQPLVILALQLGADLLRDGDRYGNFRSAPFRRAFDFYLDLFRRGLAPGTGEAAVTNVYQDFASGFFSLYISGPWNLGEFARRLPGALHDRWATAPLPAPAGGYPGISLAGGASLAIFRTSGRKEAAWRLIEHFSSPAEQRQFHRLTGDLPARRSAWADGALRQGRARAFWTQLQAVRSTPKIPEWERITSKIVQHAESAIRSERTPEEAVAALDGDVDVLLEKRRWLLGEREGR